MSTATLSTESQAYIAFEKAFLHVAKGYGFAQVEPVGVTPESVTVQVHFNFDFFCIPKCTEAAALLVANNNKLPLRLQDMVVCDPIVDWENKKAIVKLVF